MFGPLLRRFGMAALCLFAALATAQAAIDYYVFIPGVPGEARPLDRRDWIEALGFGAVVEGNAANGAPSLPPIFVGKKIDKASPLLTQAISARNRFESVTLEMVDRASGRILYHLVLHDVLCTSNKQTGEDAGTVEELTLNYLQIEWVYQPPTGAGVSTYWDKERNKGGIGPLPTPTPPPFMDSDMDGMPDEYEKANGLNPFLDDSGLDLDLDGAINIDEYRAGTIANNPNSVFRVSGMSQANGTMLITWNSVAGKVYQVLASGSFDGPYTVVKASIPSAGTGQTSTTVAFSGASLFYKVQTQ